jgi:glycolate oxidase FAD binding subunit
MPQLLRPADAGELREAVASAAAAGAPLAVAGANTKAALGRPIACDHVLDLSRLSGIAFYEPEELVISAAAGTPVSVVEETLKAGGQEMCFEPADYGPLLGAPAGGGTIGGVFACNISGPRRVKSGAARDFLLGAKAVNGRGEAFKCGGRVMKNVTGYDVCKLLAGSFGTLAVMSEVTFKVLPLPSLIHTVLVLGLDDAAAVAALTAALKSPHEVYGTAHLPAAVAARSAVPAVRTAGKAVTAVRVEGPEPSIRYCCGKLAEMFRGRGALAELGDADSAALWREIRDVAAFVPLRDRVVWRLSVTPSKGAEVVRDIHNACDSEVLYDWAGGLIWLAVAAGGEGPDAVAAQERAIRHAVAKAGGHALLMRASEAARARLPVFQPQRAAAAALTLRLKESFDPNRILNPGRMYEGV